MLRLFLLLLFAVSLTPNLKADAPVYDLVIYGGTSGGVAAAVQASRMKATVVLVEPSQRLGGLSSGGLGQTDIGNKHVVGGISREFYERIARYYENDAVWKWQPKASYQSIGQSKTEKGETSMWTFEPQAAKAVFDALVADHEIPVVFGQRLDLEKGVTMKDGHIASIQMESGEIYRGHHFIDATYEGDLMAKAGVSYHVGREANARYGETLNGVQTKNATKHQFVPGVDAYVVKGDPTSGLLPLIDPSGPGEEGGEDRRVQAYCFRMTLTDHPENRLPFEKPDGYDEKKYEVLFRNFEAGETRVPIHSAPMPNRKTDTNNNHGFSTDFIGGNTRYPEAGYDERARIIETHLHYQVPSHTLRRPTAWKTSI
ncbi:MAG: FAD-dependent oxidoreductase [Verrucomicrobiota bacterium]